MFDINNMEFMMTISPKDMKIGFKGDAFYFNLPINVHFGAIL